MIAEPKPPQITSKEAAAIEFATFPGGYRPCETKGDCWFDAETARMVINFAPRYFRHVKAVPGNPPFVLEPWQKDIFGTLFGWKRLDGLRRYRAAYLEVARGNGKSMMCVAIAGILLFVDDEPGAEIVSAAGTREQAHEVFDPFKINVLSNSILARRSRCYLNSITRLDPSTGFPIGVYKAVSADAGGNHGGSAYGIIFDELHVQKNRDLWDVLHSSKIKRAQPLSVAITTAGFDKHSICYEQRTYAEKVRDGSLKDDKFLPVIYAADPEDDWKDPETWKKANPNWGVSIDMAKLAEECERAKEVPGYENTFKRLHLNIWTEQDSRWFSMESWNKCGGSFAEANLEGEECIGALDLSTTTDITAFELYFPKQRAVLSYFWIPQENIHLRVKRDRVPYDVWARDGSLFTTAGNSVDYVPVRAHINALNKRFRILKIARDRWNASDITNQLQGDGFEIVDFGQGYASMSPAGKELERLILSGELQHGNHPVLNWMASNVTVEQDAAGNLKPSKGKSRERIDGIVALTMAIGTAIVQPPSLYPELIVF